MDIRMRDREQDPQEFQERFLQSQADLEIIGPGEDKRIKIQIEEVKGIDIKVDVSGGMLVYELKVPFRSSEQYPYAIGARPGEGINVGLEIPKMDRNAMRNRMGGRGSGGMGRPGGGMGGMGGGRGGMGMGSGRRPRMPNGLNVWVSLKLAAATN